MKAYGYNCTVCDEPIVEPQATAHSDNGLAHASCLAAQTLGRLAKGKPKHYSAAELARRTERLALARLKRWPKKPA